MSIKHPSGWWPLVFLSFPASVAIMATILFTLTLGALHVAAAPVWQHQAAVEDIGGNSTLGFIPSLGDRSLTKRTVVWECEKDDNTFSGTLNNAFEDALTMVSKPFC